ncbi:ABC transporter substrate-binding protein [uncultured Thiodictyon sp.]|uniref:ABC transporter substrate-binding protein n=1 Tax=uncultured Thiodictyon sp. TaxID=1846217 RepID=UPI0025DC33B9|nr:ABC transporter substrate-binding protein [uncultured Thiodictyon sp.]
MTRCARNVIGLGLMLLLLGVTQAQETVTTPIRFGNLGPSTSDLYQYLGQAQGIYRRYGVDLEFVEFLQGGPEAVAAAASGQLDMGTAGTPVLIAISRGILLRLVGASPRKGQAFVLVGRPDTQDLAELKGKVVGISAVGGGSAQALRVILEANGVAGDTVKTIAFGAGPNGYLSLKSGRLAAAVLTEPSVTKAERDGIGKVLAEAAPYFPHYQAGGVFATRSFIAAHSQAIRAFFKANREAIAYARAHREELVALGHQRLGLDEALLTGVFDKEVPKWDDSGSIDNEGLLNAIAVVQSVGDISKDYRPAIEDITDPSFLN